MLTAADVMTTEVVSVEPDTPVRDIAELLYTRRISGVLVIEHDHVIGIVSEGDLIGHAAAIGEPRQDQPWAHLYTDDIVVENSVVHLHGTVRTEDERRALRIAAENVPGVQSVEDHLMVWTPPPI